MFLKHLIIYTWILQGKPEKISFWFISLHEAYCRRDVHAAGWGRELSASCKQTDEKTEGTHCTDSMSDLIRDSSVCEMNKFLVNNLFTTQQKIYVPLWARKEARRPQMMQKARASDHRKLLDDQENSSTYFVVHSRTKFLKKIFSVCVCLSQAIKTRGLWECSKPLFNSCGALGSQFVEARGIMSLRITALDGRRVSLFFSFGRFVLTLLVDGAVCCPFKDIILQWGKGRYRWRQQRISVPLLRINSSKVEATDTQNLENGEGDLVVERKRVVA